MIQVSDDRYQECVLTGRQILTFGSIEDCVPKGAEGCHTIIGPVHRDALHKYGQMLEWARSKLKDTLGNPSKAMRKLMRAALKGKHDWQQPL